MQYSSRNVRQIPGASDSVYRAALPGTSNIPSIVGARWFARPTGWLSPVLLMLAVVFGGSLLVGLALVAPRAGMLVLVCVLVFALWRWMRIDFALHYLAAQLMQHETLGKLEVGQGAWGALCHALNGLLQQQRLFRRSQDLLPSLPSGLMNDLLEGRIDTGQTRCAATALLVGLSDNGEDSAADQAARWVKLAALAQRIAAPHDAMVQRCGSHLLLVFGLGRQSFTPAGMRAALHAAVELRTRWEQACADDGALVMAITAGSLVAGAVDGLGYGVVGRPIAEAQKLQGHAVAYPRYTALCDESCYVALHQLGANVKSLRISETETIYALVS